MLCTVLCIVAETKLKSFCGCWCLGSPSVVKKFRVATRRIYGFWGQQKRVQQHCKQRGDEIDKKISRRQFTRQLWYHSKKTKITVNNCWSCCGCSQYDRKARLLHEIAYWSMQDELEKYQRNLRFSVYFIWIFFFLIFYWNDWSVKNTLKMKQEHKKVASWALKINQKSLTFS